MLFQEYYYYRYRQLRRNIKNIVDIGNYQTAKTNLQNIIAEYNSKYSESTNRDFNYGEKLMLEHAKNHLDVVIDKNDPPFLDNGIIKHHSDTVKDALLREPKSDYT